MTLLLLFPLFSTASAQEEVSTARNFAGVRLGAAAQPVDGQMITGPLLTAEYRYEEDHLGLRVVPLEIGILSGEGAGGLRLSGFRFEGQYIFRPEHEISPYASGGLGTSLHFLGTPSGDYFDASVDATLGGGVILGRGRNVRWLAEADLILPLHRITSAYGLSQTWPFMATLNVGAVWGTNRTVMEITEGIIARFAN